LITTEHTIIKEYVNIPSGVVRVILRTPTYARSLAHFERLYAEAQKDYPNLAREQVDVTHYGGDSYKGTFGIEFDVTTEPTNGYAQRAQVERTI
jgi:hypothetical protein